MVGQDPRFRARRRADAQAANAHAGRQLIFWGPPGTGKNHGGAAARRCHQDTPRAALGGVLRRCRPPRRRSMGGAAAARRDKGTHLFVDEVHRFNRAQQDSFLPVMEDGTVALVGATTNKSILRAQRRIAVAPRGVLVFHSIDADAIEKLFVHAEKAEGKTAARCRGARLLKCTWPIETAVPLKPWPRKFGAPHAAAKSSMPCSCWDILQRRPEIYDKSAGRSYNPDLGAAIKGCEAPIPTRRCSPSRAPCSMPAKTRCSWPGRWCAWPSRTSASPIRRRGDCRGGK